MQTRVTQRRSNLLHLYRPPCVLRTLIVAANGACFYSTDFVFVSTSTRAYVYGTPTGYTLILPCGMALRVRILPLTRYVDAVHRIREPAGWQAA